MRSLVSRTGSAPSSTTQTRTGTGSGSRRRWRFSPRTCNAIHESLRYFTVNRRGRLCFITLRRGSSRRLSCARRRRRIRCTYPGEPARVRDVLRAPRRVRHHEQPRVVVRVRRGLRPPEQDRDQIRVVLAVEPTGGDAPRRRSLRRGRRHPPARVPHHVKRHAGAVGRHGRRQRYRRGEQLSGRGCPPDLLKRPIRLPIILRVLPPLSSSSSSSIATRTRRASSTSTPFPVCVALPGPGVHRNISWQMTRDSASARSPAARNAAKSGSASPNDASGPDEGGRLDRRWRAVAPFEASTESSPAVSRSTSRRYDACRARPTGPPPAAPA